MGYVQPCGYLVYGDPSLRINKKWFENKIYTRARKYGYYGRQTLGPIALYTHPGKLNSF